MEPRFIAKKIAKVVTCVAALLALFSYITMLLWNAILPSVIHVSTITFWQAMGILALSKILFSGLGGGGGFGRYRKEKIKGRMMEKWKGMSEEERERFKQLYKRRFERWGRMCQTEKVQTGQPGAE